MRPYRTEVIEADAAAIDRAASLLRAGEVVAFPTETVYGLGADALRGEAALKIFRAKQRPADNPLIAHIAEPSALEALAKRVDARAERLMRRFWPGPLTLIFEKTGLVPDAVSAGLSTVAVRMPAHPVALALIRAAGRPIAAPSANRSGRPSPTEARHVLEDLGGRIPMILDGGACGVGLESTVLDISGERPAILRPGGVTFEMLKGVLPDVTMDRAVLAPLEGGSEARSPGMKHKHYAPRADVVVVRGGPDAVAEKTAKLYQEAETAGGKPYILCSGPMADRYAGLCVSTLGDSPEEMAAGFFAALRALDARGATLILAEAVAETGMGLALMNRLLRAADFHVVDAEA